MRIFFIISYCFFIYSTKADFKLVVCTQNAHLLSNQEQQSEQLHAIFKRIYHNDCDVAALQELYGDLPQIKSVLDKIQKLLNYNSFSSYNYLHEDQSTNLQQAVFYKTDKFKSSKLIEYKKQALPRFYPNEKIKYPVRPPFIFELKLKLGGDLLFANIHFKSKRFSGASDYTGLSHELERMQSATQVREILDSHQHEIKFILGDRHSLHTSASSSILRGETSLYDYFSGNCILSKLGNNFCSEINNSDYFSLAYSKKSIQGTLLFKNKIQSIDDILIKTDKKIFYSSRVDKKFKDASDHFMLISEIVFN